MTKVKYLKFQDSPVLVDKAYDAQNAKHADEAAHATNADNAVMAGSINRETLLPTPTETLYNKHCFYDSGEFLFYIAKVEVPANQCIQRKLSWIGEVTASSSSSAFWVFDGDRTIYRVELIGGSSYADVTHKLDIYTLEVSRIDSTYLDGLFDSPKKFRSAVYANNNIYIFTSSVIAYWSTVSKTWTTIQKHNNNIDMQLRFVCGCKDKVFMFPKYSSTLNVLYVDTTTNNLETTGKRPLNLDDDLELIGDSREYIYFYQPSTHRIVMYNTIQYTSASFGGLPEGVTTFYGITDDYIYAASSSDMYKLDAKSFEVQATYPKQGDSLLILSDKYICEQPNFEYQNLYINRYFLTGVNYYYYNIRTNNPRTNYIKF